MTRNNKPNLWWLVGLIPGLVIGVFIGCGIREAFTGLRQASRAVEYKNIETERYEEVVEISWETEEETYGLVAWGEEMDKLNEIEISKEGWKKAKKHQVLLSVDPDRQVYFTIHSDIDLPGGSKQQVIDIDSKQLVEIRVLPTMKGGKQK